MPNRFLNFVADILRREDTSEEGQYIKLILAEYRNKRPLYEEFCAAVHKLLDSLLKENHYKYQIVSRTKTPERLREKLIRKSAAGIRYKDLSGIQDLAGIRVLFYSERDKERFVKHLKREINGTINLEDRRRRGGYEATHVVMALDPKRLELSEYKRFAKLECEIQITSLLRHAWAEIEHDFIYKDIMGLKGTDPKKFALMEQQLGKILDTHIKKASQEFEEVMKIVDEK